MRLSVNTVASSKKPMLIRFIEVEGELFAEEAGSVSQYHSSINLFGTQVFHQGFQTFAAIVGRCNMNWSHIPNWLVLLAVPLATMWQIVVHPRMKCWIPPSWKHGQIQADACGSISQQQGLHTKDACGSTGIMNRGSSVKAQIYGAILLMVHAKCILLCINHVHAMVRHIHIGDDFILQLWTLWTHILRQDLRSRAESVWVGL